jgi:alkanesulfonate monooxygenase SsuD/methylene tetrahydromethanopterin reductase-like flavin-dependent oxidoreductase (luciferase family)
VTGNVLAVSSGDQRVTLWKQALDGKWTQVSRARDRDPDVVLVVVIVVPVVDDDDDAMNRLDKLEIYLIQPLMALWGCGQISSASST